MYLRTFGRQAQLPSPASKVDLAIPRFFGFINSIVFVFASISDAVVSLEVLSAHSSFVEEPAILKIISSRRRLIRCKVFNSRLSI